MAYYLLASMPAFVCGTLTMVLLFDLIQMPQRSRCIMTIFMAVATLLYMGHFVYFTHETQLLPITDTIYCTCNPLVFPLYYVYIKSLTERHLRRWHVALLVLPAIICGILVGIAYWQTPDEAINSFINQYLFHSSMTNDYNTGTTALVVSHNISKIVFCLEIIPILVLGIRRINRYDKMLEQYYSSPEQKQLKWVKMMLILFVITSIISLVSFAIGRHYFIDRITKLAIPSTLYSLLLFTIGYIGTKQQGIEEWNEDEEEDEMEEQPSLSMNNHLSERIEKLMTEEQLYLNPQLKLKDLVSQLNSNRNYVYHAINVEMGISFAEYVNRMRIAHAEKLMKENANMPLSEVASLSGFASSTSFYRNFRKLRGCSPTTMKASPRPSPKERENFNVRDLPN